jgi:hypothetical protein
MAIQLAKELRMGIEVPTAGATAVSAQKVLEFGNRRIKLSRGSHRRAESWGLEGVEAPFAPINGVGYAPDI